MTTKNYENCKEFTNSTDGVMSGKGKGKIKKMSFRNSADVMAKFKKLGIWVCMLIFSGLRDTDI